MGKMMGKKYLVPILIGIGVLILVLVAGALLFNGQEEGAGGVAALAAVIAEVSRRRRAAARKELDDLADDAEEDITQAEELRAGVDEASEAIDAVVEETTLDDLVDEENG